MEKIKIIIGAKYVGCPDVEIEVDCENINEFESDEFSTKILMAIEEGTSDYHIRIEAPEEYYE